MRVDSGTIDVQIDFVSNFPVEVGVTEKLPIWDFRRRYSDRRLMNLTDVPTTIASFDSTLKVGSFLVASFRAIMLLELVCRRGIFA